MAIPEHFRTNFQTLLRAAADKALALMECNDAATGEPRYVLCAVGRDQGNYVVTPFGHLADGNPYEHYLPPDVPGGSQGRANPVSGSPAALSPSPGTRRKGGRRSP
ncbi:DUF6117 family protein [uncultured Sphingomonas sp.]|uniref:DUF6117 family protein n=1 Tax=uncultured Sphingomonas sp. TaxID=158754 RepID=UPI002613DC31|nr:DUF6117 family protein [uncultured Sphingomonas sp.]